MPWREEETERSFVASAGRATSWGREPELTVLVRAVIDVSVAPTNTTPESGCSC